MIKIIFKIIIIILINDLSLYGQRLEEDLVAVWHLDESSGTRLDSYSANHLSDNNNVLDGTGIVDSSAIFVSANDQFLSIGDNSEISINGHVAFTISLWVKLTSKSTDMTILAKWNSTGNNREYILNYNSGVDRFRWEVSNDGISSTTTDNNILGAPAIDVWYNIIVYHDPDANEIGIGTNAQQSLNNSTHTTGVFDGTASLTFGRSEAGGGTGDFDGEIDEVHFWKGRLASGGNERRALYRNGRARIYPFLLTDNLEIFWSLDESSGTRLDSFTNDGADDLTSVNSVTDSTAIKGRSANFLKSNQMHLETADNSTFDHDNPERNMSMAFWVSFKDTTANMTIAGQYNTESANRSHRVSYVQGTDVIRWLINGGGGGSSDNVTVDATNFGSPGLETWIFVYVFYDRTHGSNGRIGISINNGTENTVSQFLTSLGIRLVTTPFRLGAEGRPSETEINWLDGNIDNFCYFKRRLMPYEITDLYNSGRGLQVPLRRRTKIN